MKLLLLTKQVSSKNITRIVLIIGLFFIFFILTFIIYPITKDKPTIFVNDKNDKKIAQNNKLDSDSAGIVKGLSTKSAPMDNLDDAKAIWQDFVDEKLEFTQPKVALARSDNQKDSSVQESNQLTIQPTDQPTTQQPVKSPTQSTNQPFENTQGEPINQLTDFTIISFEPKDKASFTQGDKITFKAEAKDLSNSELILYKFYIDDQPISDWSDKNSLEWVAANTSAPAKHTATVEVKNSKGAVINKKQEFFLYLKPIGFE